MIYTHISSDHVLRCEVQYTELLPGDSDVTILASKARVDIVVARKKDGKREGATPEFVIEVKRASASKAQIDNDLRRLAAVKKHHPNITAYLIVIAEAERPKRFVDEKGVACSQVYQIPETSQLYRVRRVFKATHSFTSRDRAQYACLVEISPAQPRARMRRAEPWKAKSS
ncbi:hypothetical protein [Sphingomonas kyungheensis]|uniref:Uncharacterized protein n=1 Tax=Sphingomonas kyungheensis TaxID=1069987 RepID=A0ABU8H7Q7_9SPHN